MHILQKNKEGKLHQCLPSMFLGWSNCLGKGRPQVEGLKSCYNSFIQESYLETTDHNVTYIHIPLLR